MCPVLRELNHAFPSIFKPETAALLGEFFQARTFFFKEHQEITKTDLFLLPAHSNYFWFVFHGWSAQRPKQGGIKPGTETASLTEAFSDLYYCNSLTQQDASYTY